MKRQIPVSLLFSWALSIDAFSVSRRLILRHGVLLTGGAVVLIPTCANSIRGAAELDLEYYIRDLVGGNRKEGNILPTKAPAPHPPRRVSDPLQNLLLNDDCNVDCLTALALVETIFQFSPPGPPEDPRRIELDIERSVKSYRDKAKKSFYVRAPWMEEHVTDQYYFDLTSYALWRTAADLLPSYVARDAFVRKLGRFIYENALKYKLLTRPAGKTADGSVLRTIGQMEELLGLFKANGFCSDYRIGEAVRTKQDERPVFDEFDDKALASGATVDCLVSVFDPATLGASLQITGEQSRFAPDFVGATLAAMWESEGYQATWEAFFVDPTYRPNPKGSYARCRSTL
jgi:hypothetical protein